MIRKITFNNFYSFSEDGQAIDFTTSKKKSYDYYNSEKGDQITKVIGAFGGNAAGKTNICRVFGFLRYLVTNSAKPNAEMVYKNFFSNNNDSYIKVEFETKSKIFFYEIEFNKEKIIFEKLSYKQLKSNYRKTTVFSFNRKTKITSLNPRVNDDLKGLDIDYLKTIRSDISFVAHISSKQKIDLISDVYDYFEQMSGDITEGGNKMDTALKGLGVYKNDKEIREKVNDFISNFDLGLSEFKVSTDSISIKDIKDLKQLAKIIKNKDNLELIEVEGIHDNGKSLDYIYESLGTRNIASLVIRMLVAIRNDAVIVADELEEGMHPEALLKIIQYFIDENENHKAQLIFTTHIVDVMNILDSNQIVLVEKDSEGASHAFRLDKVEGIRPEHNFRAKYMSGAYGAFPHISV